MLGSGIAVYLAIQPSGRWSGRPSERDPAAGRVPSDLGDGRADPDEMISLLAGERRLRPGPR
jgi:hypothetical protein